MVWALGALAMLGAGCAAAPAPCASSLACGDGRVCLLEGRCGVLAAATSAGERSEWRSPRRWSATTAGAPRELGGDRDRLVLGGAHEGTLWLELDPIDARPARALIVLGVVERASRRTRDTIVVARRASDGAEVARVRVRPGAARPIVLDVTDDLPAAGTPLGLAIRATEPIEIATPRHLDRRARPRLELTLPDN